jgi:hypothetical protein
MVNKAIVRDLVLRYSIPVDIACNIVKAVCSPTGKQKRRGFCIILTKWFLM